MMQTEIENKYGFNMQVSARAMAAIKSGRTSEKIALPLPRTAQQRVFAYDATFVDLIRSC
jgi:hypothetical protein